MRIVYLPSTTHDLKWMRNYYGEIFPEGQKRALQQVIATEQILSDNPWIGRPYDIDDLRILPLPRTPFAFVYRLKQDRNEIIRILDQGADRQD
jgi:plasmid stabilization system protein ParE